MRFPAAGLLFAALCAAPVFAQYDLLLKGGTLIDPKNRVNARRDVAIQNGKVAGIAADIPVNRARKVIDVTGLYVTPGIVDIHAHLFHTTGIKGAWAGDSSIPPDVISFRTGVTTMVDAGSSGVRNFETFRHTVIDRARTRVFALINVAGLGMITDVPEQEESDFKPKEIAAMAKKHAGVVVGVKSAHYQKPDWTSVERAVEAGTLANIPVMVDFGYFLPERPFWQLVTQKLRPGDIATHMFRGPVPWLDGRGRLLPYLEQARNRGVLFDVGHGGGSFVLRNAVPATQQGFFPDTISTDLHMGSLNAQMQDMPTTMSKFLAMGMALPDVIARSTWNPAKVIKREERGHLSPDAAADIAVFRLLKGEFGYADAYGGKIAGDSRLICELTLLDGEVVWDWNGRTGGAFERLGPTYGIRPGIDTILAPKDTGGRR